MATRGAPACESLPAVAPSTFPFADRSHLNQRARFSNNIAPLLDLPPNGLRPVGPSRSPGPRPGAAQLSRCPEPQRLRWPQRAHRKARLRRALVGAAHCTLGRSSRSLAAAPDVAVPPRRQPGGAGLSGRRPWAGTTSSTHDDVTPARSRASARGSRVKRQRRGGSLPFGVHASPKPTRGLAYFHREVSS